MPQTTPQSKRRRVKRNASLIFLGALGVGLCFAPRSSADESVSSTTPAPPVQTTAGGGNLLEQMETTTIAIARAARPAVVSIEGRLLVPRFFAPRRKETPAPPRTPRSKQGSEPRAAPDDNEKTQREEKRKFEKILIDAQDHIEITLGTTVTGSGFLMQDGFVVTTAEVTEGAQDPVVILVDGKKLSVEWVSADKQTNIAVLKVAGVDPKLGLRWGDSSRVAPGSFTLTIGNQAGFPNSVALGVVSGTGRSGRSGSLRYKNLIQFQGAVGGGGSGGPLLNARGEVIGIIVATPAGAPGIPARRIGSHPLPSYEAVTWQEARTRSVKEQCKRKQPYDPRSIDPELEASEDNPAETPAPSAIQMFVGVSNTGFALPSNDIRLTVEMLRKREVAPFRRGWLGVRPMETEDAQKGAFIESVFVGSPADRAGLQPGDIVVSINGNPVRSTSDLQKLLKKLGAGEAMRIEATRNGVLKSFTLTIDPRPSEDAIEEIPTRDLPGR